MNNEKMTFKGFWTKLGLTLMVSVLLGFGFYLICLNHITLNQFAIYYDSYAGVYWKIEKPGWYVTSPFVRVSYITTLPMRVTVPSDALVIVSKMVRFKPEGYREFVDLQGFSFFTNIENTLLGYAYSGNAYPFLEITQDTQPEKMPVRNR